MGASGDFHTHADYVDGKSSIYEMTEAAYRIGLKHFGISEHLYSELDGWGIRGEVLDGYLLDIQSLKEKYRGRMDLLAGLEAEDYDADRTLTEYAAANADYFIRSTHVLTVDGFSFEVDNSPEFLKKVVEEHFGGDWYKLIRLYYAAEAEVNPRMNYAFIGHFDLITKFNQDDCLFSTRSDDYIQPALEAMDRLVPYGLPFEINTGAMSRGYRREPYPSAFLLKELHNRGGRIIINSDSHRRDNICYGYDIAAKLAYACGFREQCVLTSDGMITEAL